MRAFYGFNDPSKLYGENVVSLHLTEEETEDERGEVS